MAFSSFLKTNKVMCNPDLKLALCICIAWNCIVLVLLYSLGFVESGGLYYIKKIRPYYSQFDVEWKK